MKKNEPEYEETFFVCGIYATTEMINHYLSGFIAGSLDGEDVNMESILRCFISFIMDMGNCQFYMNPEIMKDLRRFETYYEERRNSYNDN